MSPIKCGRRPRGLRSYHKPRGQHVGRLPLHSSELDRILHDEKLDRRKERWRQVRIQAKEHARIVRLRVQHEREKSVAKVAQQELERYRQEKMVELTTLEEEYRQCLRDIGVGFEEVQREEEYQRFKALQMRLEAQKADARGRKALQRELKNQQWAEKHVEGRRELKKAALLTEKLRAADLRRQILPSKGQEPLAMIEIEPDRHSIRSKIVPRQTLVQDFPHRPQSGRVRRVPLSEVDINGLEAAIEAQRPTERRVHFKAPEFEHEQAKLIKELRKQDEQDRQRNREVSFNIDPSPSSSSSSSKCNDRSDLDTVPVRGPSSTSNSSSAETSNQSNSSTSTTTPPSRLTVTLGGPNSAFQAPNPRESDDSEREFEELRELLIKAQEQSRDLMTVDGRGQGAKTQADPDQDFVSKVLGFPLNEPGKLELQVRVAEFSSSYSSNTSTDITKERFISGPLQPGPVTNSRDVPESTDQADAIHSLIGRLKTSAVSDPNQNLLRFYIEKLLDMKREEIRDLSISESSINPSSLSSSSGFVASTPASILHTQCSEISQKNSSGGSSSSSKTVRFQDDLDGTYAGQPTTRHSGMGKKKHIKAQIAFQTKISLEELQKSFEEQKRALEEQLTLRRQKRDLRSSRSSQSSQSSDPSLGELSGGPLSSSTSSHQSDPKSSPVSSHNSGRPSAKLSDASTNSTKESSMSSSSTLGSNPTPPDIDQMLQNLKLSWAHSMMRRMKEQAAVTGINKSSSSGSSGSAALADIKSKLASMEMPRLQKARPVGVESSAKSSEDTLAQLPDLVADEVRQVEEVPAITITDFSTFQLSDVDKLAVSSGEEVALSHISFTSDSDIDTKIVKNQPEKN
ncbi:serine-rich adhesin for platelets-like [Tigriopus californicus]|uniref:serine-rich adhesin for platelets-like n=1 Tax=Tigriopus californicus TaxID=6832 RepID=UPI0027DA1451|nr:serine-rich adhesin for platelets-like [Tigriopus californicus]